MSETKHTPEELERIGGAAPELLDSLRTSMTVIEFMASELGRLDAITASDGYQKARAAIAKAEGRG